MSNFKIWECQICNWIYDEEKGDPEEGLAPGTRWEDIPEDWCCPECGVGKDGFEMVEIKQGGAAEQGNSQQENSQQENSQQENSQQEKSQPEIAPQKSETAVASDAEPDEEAPLIIIGTGLAGYNLVKEIRRTNKSMPIVMYTADDGVLYSKPNLSVGFSANKSAADLAMDSAESLAQKLNIEVNIFTKVSGIDTRKKTITLEKGGSRPYHKLVLATGANCIDAPLKGDAISKIHKVNDLLDYARFRTLIGTDGKQSPKHVLVIGGGLIGSEYADDLTRAGHKVSIVDPLDGLLATLLPPEASQILTENLKSAGVQLHCGTVVDSINHSGSGVLATLKNGAQIQADLVLSAIGVRPNVQLAKQAGINCNRGITTGRDLQTSAPDVYAIGDCVEVEGQVLVYIAPLTAQVKALAKNFCGEATQVSYGVMPVMVKTKLHPVTVNPPFGATGQWIVDVKDSSGVKARFVDESGNLLGYALTGNQCRENAKLMRGCPKLLE